MKDKTIEKLSMLKDLPAAQPDGLYVKNTRIRVLNRVGAETRKAPKIAHTLRSAVTRWAFLGMAGSMLLGTTVVYAAQYSKPGSTLYPVRIASENAAVSLAPGNALKTQVATAVIDRRAADIESSATGVAGTQNVERAVKQYSEFVDSWENDRRIDRREVERHVVLHAEKLKKYLRLENGDNRDQNADAADQADDSPIRTLPAGKEATGTPKPEETGTKSGTPVRSDSEVKGISHDSSEERNSVSGHASVEKSQEHELYLVPTIVGEATSAVNDTTDSLSR